MYTLNLRVDDLPPSNPLSFKTRRSKKVKDQKVYKYSALDYSLDYDLPYANMAMAAGTFLATHVRIVIIVIICIPKQLALPSKSLGSFSHVETGISHKISPVVLLFEGYNIQGEISSEMSVPSVGTGILLEISLSEQ